MKRTTKTVAALTLGSTLALAGAAWAKQGQGQKSGKSTAPVAAVAEIVSTTGTVQSIDKDKRTIVLKDAAGDQIKMQVPPDMPNFDQLKKGQKADVTYYDSIAVAFLPSGAAQPAAEVRVRVEPAQQGGVVGREITVAAEVVNVDSKNKQVELKLPSGQTQKINVADTDLQKHLGDLKPGQLATITYTEAVAASLDPPSSQRAAR
jgi:ribosomal protein L2